MRSSGQGMPDAESSGSEGDERMYGGPEWSLSFFWFLRRKENMSMARVDRRGSGREKRAAGDCTATQRGGGEKDFWSPTEATLDLRFAVTKDVLPNFDLACWPISKALFRLYAPVTITFVIV